MLVNRKIFEQLARLLKNRLLLHYSTEFSMVHYNSDDPRGERGVGLAPKEFGARNAKSIIQAPKNVFSMWAKTIHFFTVRWPSPA